MSSHQLVYASRGRQMPHQSKAKSSGFPCHLTTVAFRQVSSEHQHDQCVTSRPLVYAWYRRLSPANSRNSRTSEDAERCWTGEEGTELPASFMLTEQAASLHDRSRSVGSQAEQHRKVRGTGGFACRTTTCWVSPGGMGLAGSRAWKPCALMAASLWVSPSTMSMHMASAMVKRTSLVAEHSVEMSLQPGVSF